MEVIDNELAVALTARLWAVVEQTLDDEHGPGRWTPAMFDEELSAELERRTAKLQEGIEKMEAERDLRQRLLAEERDEALRRERDRIQMAERRAVVHICNTWLNDHMENFEAEHIATEIVEYLNEALRGANANA